MFAQEVLTNDKEHAERFLDIHFQTINQAPYRMKEQLWLVGRSWSLKCAVISRKFLIKYYEYSFDYPITITNQFMINAHT